VGDANGWYASIVLIVRHVKVAGLVHRDAGRIVQAVGADPNAGKLETAAGAKDPVGVRVRQWRIRPPSRRSMVCCTEKLLFFGT
jgi:hypothetical protein